MTSRYTQSQYWAHGRVQCEAHPIYLLMGKNDAESLRQVVASLWPLGSRRLDRGPDCHDELIHRREEYSTSRIPEILVNGLLKRNVATPQAALTVSTGEAIGRVRIDESSVGADQFD